MKSLTEFDHAVDAVFGNQRRVTDQVQDAWLDSTTYSTVWWGIVCDMDVVVSDDLEDEWDVPDESSCCDYRSPFEPVPPTWQLFRSCEARTALMSLGEELFERHVRAASFDEDIPFYEEDFLNEIGIMPYERSHFVEPPERYGASCTT